MKRHLAEIGKGATYLKRVIISFCFVVLNSPQIVGAEIAIEIGKSFTFTAAENAQAGCRFGQDTVSCKQFLGETAARAATREVETSARFGVFSLNFPIGVPVYSTASVYNDFVIPGPPDGNMIDVQITVQYDFFGTFLSGGLYTLNNSLSLRVQDRTANALVARHELAKMERQGDQPITGLDTSAAEERSVLTGEVGHFIVKLRRGHHYRLHFELESSAVSFLAGALRADAYAQWHRLSINVGEDQVELLEAHDQQVKAMLLGVEKSLLGALAKHDSDIKAELANIKNQLNGINQDLEEIKTLLLTPQGLRDGFPINPKKKK
jgi:hypothetical protein